MSKFFRVLSRHAPALIAVNVSIAAVILVLRALTYSEVWLANAKLSLPDASANLTVDLGPLGSLENVSPDFSSQINPLKLQRAILQSDVVMGDALALDPEKQEFGKLSSYKKLFTIDLAEQTPIIQITVEGDSQDVAKTRLDNLLTVYQQRLDELRRANSESINSFNQEELLESKDRLNLAQDQLVNFQESVGLVNPDVQVESLVDAISNLQDEFIKADAESLALQEQVSTLSRRLALSPEDAITALSLDQNQGYLQVRERFIETSVQLNQALARYTPSHPQVRQLADLQGSLEQQLQQYIGNVGSDTANTGSLLTSGVEGQSELIQEMVLAESLGVSRRRQARQISEELDDLRGQLQQMPEASARLLELQRNYEVAESIYKGLVAQAQQANIDSFSSYPNIQTLDPPRIDPVPQSPSLRLIIANAIIAMAFTSLATILLLERRDPLLASSDLRRFEFPLVANLPVASSRPLDLDCPELRWLAASVSSSCPRGNAVLVASAAQNEERESTALALGITLGRLGYSTLIVSIGESSRLSHLLDVSKDDYQLSQPIAIDANTAYLPISEDDPNFTDEAIVKGRCGATVDSLIKTSAFDYVLIDTPPVTLEGKALLLTSAFDNVLYVIRPGYSKRNSVLKALNQLVHRGVNLLGIVVNTQFDGQFSVEAQHGADRSFAQGWGDRSNGERAGRDAAHPAGGSLADGTGLRRFR